MERFWKDLHEGNKKKLFYQAVMGVVVMALAVGVYLMVRPPRHRVPLKPEVTTHKEDLTKQSWLSTATKRLEEQERKMKQMQKQLEQLEKMAKTQKQPKLPPPPRREEKKALTFNPPPPPPPVAKTPVAPGQPKEQQPSQKAITIEPVDLIAVVKGTSAQKARSAESIEKTLPKKEKRHLETIENTIPAGSFTSGILLSGLDAPTGGKARSSPHPVLIRLTDLTILPNKFYSDIKSCFVIGEGYGDLSSEKAYIRLNTLSCVKEDTSILERKIEGYVSGEDGKIGLRGRVVSKQGALLARTLVAGFLEGAGRILQYQGTTIGISPLGATQTVEPGKVAQVSMYSGAAEAAKKLADFYMKLVNETFPVVEINAGRKVEIIFLKKVNLEEKS